MLMMKPALTCACDETMKKIEFFVSGAFLDIPSTRDQEIFSALPGEIQAVVKKYLILCSKNSSPTLTIESLEYTLLFIKNRSTLTFSVNIQY